MTRRLRDTRAELQERNQQLDVEREANARRAVLEERVRIARELHDVVAHHVSLIAVQAGVARRLFGSRPDEVEAITAIEAPAATRSPTLSQLPSLVAQMEQAGLPVQLTVEGGEHPLAPGVELSAHRIVQEALTNTLEHAGPARAHVKVRYDDGQGPPNGEVAGTGLVGMRERVNPYGGHLDVGARPGGASVCTRC